MKTMQLLDRAAAHFASQREMSKALGFSATTLGNARMRGRLSPVVAGMLARELGEDVIYWTAIAALENEKPSKARDTLLMASTRWRKL